MNSRTPALRAFLVPGWMIGAMAFASLRAAPLLPAVVPTHFDLHGEPNGWSSRTFVLFFMPVLTAGVMAFIQFPLLASRELSANSNGRRSLDQVLAGVALLLFGIHCGLVFGPLGWISFQKAFSWGMTLLLIVVGNALRKTERNRIVGIRLPWTLASDANWRATHRFAARAMLGAGVLLGAITSVRASMDAAIFLLLAPFLSSILYSYLRFRRER